ncbi:MAG: type I-B CRISPR-associated protein Cas8b1/Cst1 [Saccharospirillaceae bacterium]|nr:type I-B CRISPR-associated protein Cas8b1/Cst1 [Pseudomonadales bacterium]NRB81201.1 type I-B CRISPR-associated protein Cas8b1/Cst1 [Saccharospirillaceae bacterium]
MKTNINIKVKSIFTKILNVMVCLLLVSCASTGPKTITKSMDSKAVDSLESTEMVLEIQSEPDFMEQAEVEEESEQIKYINYVTSIETAINDKSLNKSFINKKTLSNYITIRDIFTDITVINKVNLEDIILQKIVNSTVKSDVWYFDTVYSLSQPFMIARFLVYYDDGNMSVLDIYLDKNDYSIVDVLVAEESFTVTDKIANILHLYNRTVHNTITGKYTIHSVPNAKAPILKSYYPEEQRSLANILTKIQTSTNALQVVSIYKNLDNKYKTLHMLEYILLKAVSDNWSTAWLYKSLSDNTDKNSSAYVFFTLFLYTTDEFDQFIKYSKQQNIHYKQSLAWNFYQFIAAKILEDNTGINETSYQILTRFGAYDFVYYLMTLQYIRMNQLEVANMIEMAMLDRFNYQLSVEDLELTDNGKAYILQYRN